MSTELETETENQKQLEEATAVYEKHKDQFARRLAALPVKLREYIEEERKAQAEEDPETGVQKFNAMQLPYELVYAEAAVTVCEVITDPQKIYIFSIIPKVKQMQMSWGYEKMDATEAGKELSTRVKKFRFFDYSLEQARAIWERCTLLYPKPPSEEQEEEEEEESEEIYNPLLA